MANSPDRLAMKQLFALCGNECAFPDCEIQIIDFDTKVSIGAMCHIKGRQPNSPRYDKTQSVSERNKYKNLILLCPTHHKMIDSVPKRYPVKLLLKMKKDHEDKMAKRMRIKEVIEDWVVDELLKTNEIKKQLAEARNTPESEYVDL